MRSLAPKFDTFDVETEKWEQYFQRFEHHLDIYNISSDEKRRACLLSWAGASTYNLLQNLFGGEKLADKTYKELTEKLHAHFKDVVHVQAARYAFYNCKMQPGQSYADWAANLRGLAKDCNFRCKSDQCNNKSYVDEQIRDVIIKETPHADIRRQCLQDPDPTLQSVLQKATAYIKTSQTDQVLKGCETSKETVNKMSSGYAPRSQRGRNVVARTRQPTKLRSCPKCFDKHERRDCPCRDMTCFKCGKKGHVKSVCRKKEASTETSLQVMKVQEQCVGHVMLCNQSSETILQKKTYYRTGSQIWVKTCINGVELDFQWDTGSTCSMISLNGYRKLGSPACQPLNAPLRAYGDRPLNVKGECFVDVKIGSATNSRMRLIVVNELKGANLLGLDWSDAFGITDRGIEALDKLVEDGASGPTSVNTVNARDEQQKLSEFINKFPDVFSPELGKCRKLKVKIHLKDGSKPVFSMPRRCPFAMRRAVQNELERLVKMNVLESVDYSEWAVPIVVVSKPNGSVRICGDFKVLNQQLQVDQHPIPTLDSLMQSLQGGQQYSKIDLADAYLQLELDDNSKKLCVINTPFGLYRYNRMCFGVASSPAPISTLYGHHDFRVKRRCCVFR